MSNYTLLPQNVEAEIGVLGCMLVEESIVADILPMLHRNYFLVPAHQVLFDVIAYLSDQNRPIGPVSVLEELKRRGAVEEVGGQNYLCSLMEAVLSGGNAYYYAQLVREKGIMRHLIEAAGKIVEETTSGHLELEALLDRAEKLIFEVTQREISSEPTPLHTILTKVSKEFGQDKKSFAGIPSGFRDLDELISGLQNSSLVIIAGRPSMGKTSFALNIAAHVGLHQQQSVLFFSLEMSKEQIAQNILCSWVGISPHKIRRGVVTEEEYAKVMEGVGVLGEAPIFIDDSSSLSLREIRAKSRRFKSKHHISLVIIDYLQLLENPESRRSENRQQELSQISRALKNMARELDVPTVALSQLNRSVDTRDDHRPRMSDLRESGALEQDADLILFLYRDEYYNKDTSEPGIAEVIVAKQRNGPVGSVRLAFVKDHMRFLGLEYLHKEPF